MRFPHPGGYYGGFAQIASDIVTGLFFLIVLAVVVGLIFLLVRYLLVATKAAQLYIANNTIAPATSAATTPEAFPSGSTAEENSLTTTRAPRAPRPRG